MHFYLYMSVCPRLCVHIRVNTSRLSYLLWDLISIVIYYEISSVSDASDPKDVNEVVSVVILWWPAFDNHHQINRLSRRVVSASLVPVPLCCLSKNSNVSLQV